MRVSLLLAAAVALSHLTLDVRPAAAQDVSSPYLDLVWRYRAGDHAGAVAAAMGMPVRGWRARAAEDLGPLLCRTLDLKNVEMCLALAVPDGKRLRLVGLWRRLLPAALLLHLEVHARLQDPEQTAAKRVHEDVVVDLVRRLRVLGTSDDGTLMPELRSWADEGARLLLWSLQLDRDQVTARTLLGGPLRQWMAMPDLILAAGWVDELSARDAALRVAHRRASRRERVEGRLGWLRRERRSRLTAAESAYRRAIEEGAGPEARIRLGRVLMLSAVASGPGRPDPARLDESLAQLRAGLESATTEREAYLAALFLAGALEAGDTPASVRALYERALRHWPAAQAARIGLSRRLSLDGEVDRARTLAEVGSVKPASRLTSLARDDDPWFWYDYGQAWRFGPELERLRGSLP